MFRRLAQSPLLWNRGFASTAVGQPVYLIFGATGGIGSEVCKLLTAQEGARVVLAARNSSKLEGLSAQLGGQHSSVVVDPLSPEQVDACVADVLKTFGKVDGVANCVGSVLLKSAHTTSLKEFDDVLDINLRSSFNVLRASVKAMMKGKGGSIVFCSSAVAKHGIANHEAIAAAKGGLAAMALSAAATYAPRNIRVNCVSPGLTNTPLAARITSVESALKASTSMHALKRIAEPVEVAAAIEFLLNPANSFITGQNLGVDGGLGSVRAA